MAKKEKHCRKIKKDLSIENIKEVNEKVEKKAKGFWADFKKFVAKGNIIDLAVAVVVGTAFNKVVNALVTNIITPLTSRILPKGDFSMLKIVLEPAVEADPENGIAAVEEVAVTYGAFLETLLDFLIIALTIYVVMKVFLKLKNTIHRREIEAAEARAKALEEKKKREAEEEHARQEKIKNDFLEDVSVQADVLNDIKEIMLRMEKRQSGLGGD